MSDTSTKQKERQVEYGIMEELDELPGRPQKSSPIQDLLEQIKADTAKHGKWLMIAKYANGSAATATANVERQRRGGDQTISGWKFATRRVDEGTNTGLFANYDPSQIEGTPDERNARHQAWLEARKARAEKLRQAREAKAAKTTERETKDKPSQRKAS